LPLLGLGGGVEPRGAGVGGEVQPWAELRLLPRRCATGRVGDSRPAHGHVVVGVVAGRAGRDGAAVVARQDPQRRGLGVRRRRRRRGAASDGRPDARCADSGGKGDGPVAPPLHSSSKTPLQRAPTTNKASKDDVAGGGRRRSSKIRGFATRAREREIPSKYFGEGGRGVRGDAVGALRGVGDGEIRVGCYRSKARHAEDSWTRVKRVVITPRRVPACRLMRAIPFKHCAREPLTSERLKNMRRKKKQEGKKKMDARGKEMNVVVRARLGHWELVHTCATGSHAGRALPGR
jgi:hypothetical protein